MKKQRIISDLLKIVQDELKHLEVAYKETSNFKQSSESKPESKYDTQGTEASYLADGQLKRIEELKLELQMLEEIPLKEFGQSDEIAIGALVEIEFKKQKRLYFISSTAGGSMVNIDGTVVLVISVFSPIGSETIGLKIGDRFEIETSQENREYLITGLS